MTRTFYNLRMTVINFTNRQFLRKSYRNIYFPRVFSIEDTSFHCFTQVANQSL